jgi:hypothetical protein
MDTYKWKTEYSHNNNEDTMMEYLDYHLDADAEIIDHEGTSAEILLDGVKYGVHASGDGDSFHHKVEFEEL